MGLYTRVEIERRRVAEGTGGTSYADAPIFPVGSE